MADVNNPSQPQPRVWFQDNEKQLMAEMKNLKKEKALLHETILSKNHEITTLRQENKMCMVWRDQVKELKKFQDENTILKNRNIKLQSESQQLRQQHAVDKSWRKQKEKDLTHYKTIEKEIKKKDAVMSKLQQQRDKTERMNEQTQIKLQETMELLQTERGNQAETQEKLDQERQSNDILSDKVKNLKHVKAQHDLLQGEHGELKKELKKCEDQYKVWKKQAQTLAKELQKEKIRNEMLKNKIAVKNPVIEKLQREVQYKEAQTKTQAEEADQMQKANTELQREINRLNDKYESDHKKITAVMTNKDKSNALLSRELRNREDSERQLMLQIEELKKQIVTVEEKRYQVQAQLSESLKENDSLKDINARLHRDNSQKSEELDKRSSEIVSLQHQVDQTKAHKKEMKDTAKERVTLLDKDLTRSKEILSRSEADNEQFTKELRQREEVIMKLEARLEQQEKRKRALEEIVSSLTNEKRNLEIENEGLQEFKTMYQYVIDYMPPIVRKEKKTEEVQKETTTKRLLRLNELLEEKTKHLEEKDKEIEELKQMLARRPDDALKKLQRSLWGNRSLKEKLQGQEAMIRACQTAFEKAREEKNKLEYEVRELRVQNKSAFTRLPPISEGRDKTTEQSEPGGLPGSKQIPKAKERKLVVLPPISVSGKQQLPPHPLPPNPLPDFRA